MRSAGATAVTGGGLRFTKITRDITERKAVEDALTESESRYRLLANNVADMVTTIGPDFDMRYVSPSCSRFGYKPQELIGCRLVSLIHPDDYQLARGTFERLFKGEPQAGLQHHYRLLRKDGSYVRVEGNPTVMEGSLGGSREILNIFRDVTERHRMEDFLAAAKNEAEAATAVKADFLSNMSHELRTPLTGILGFSSILRRERGLSDEGRRSIDRITGCGRALLTIVNDILDFSKLEAGQVEIIRRSANPHVLLSDVLGLMEAQAGPKGLALALDVGAGLPVDLMIDAGRVHQVLLNLLSNAVKFTQQGSVRLSARYDAETERLRFEATDTGAGISRKSLEKLFQRFSQVDASTTRAHGGTGLGLAICKGLVEAMGGEVGAQSVVGEGSCFWFEVPCGVAETSRDDSCGEVGSAHSAIAGMRILVTDDNALNREIIRLVLAPYGAVVTEAGAGEDAVRLANERLFDVILMDIAMPGVDGPTAAKAIRDGDGPNELVPIIAFTAHDPASVASQWWAALFDDQLNKPVVPADLLEKLLRWAPEPLQTYPTRA